MRFIGIEIAGLYSHRIKLSIVLFLYFKNMCCGKIWKFSRNIFFFEDEDSVWEFGDLCLGCQIFYNAFTWQPPIIKSNSRNFTEFREIKQQPSSCHYRRFYDISAHNLLRSNKSFIGRIAIVLCYCLYLKKEKNIIRFNQICSIN